MGVNCKTDIVKGNTIRSGNHEYVFITDLEKRKYHSPYSLDAWSVEMYAADAVQIPNNGGIVPVVEMRWSIKNNTEDRCCYWPVPSSVWQDLDTYDLDASRRIYHPGKPKYQSLW